jgi:hypothetical protein
VGFAQEDEARRKGAGSHTAADTIQLQAMHYNNRRKNSRGGGGGGVGSRKMVKPPGRSNTPPRWGEMFLVRRVSDSRRTCPRKLRRGRGEDDDLVQGAMLVAITSTSSRRLLVRWCIIIHWQRQSIAIASALNVRFQ